LDTDSLVYLQRGYSIKGTKELDAEKSQGSRIAEDDKMPT
jgi:hypothetical protein